MDGEDLLKQKVGSYFRYFCEIQMFKGTFRHAKLFLGLFPHKNFCHQTSLLVQLGVIFSKKISETHQIYDIAAGTQVTCFKNLGETFVIFAKFRHIWPLLADISTPKHRGRGLDNGRILLFYIIPTFEFRFFDYLNNRPVFRIVYWNIILYGHILWPLLTKVERTV